MNSCDESHKCFQPEDILWSELPTRVLKVDSKGASPIFLVEGKLETGHYATLSHCWGKHWPIRLLESNVTEFMQTGIPFARFPKTFQDAIEVARSLGPLYLWIDSLCILQDSEEDWIKESVLMYKVYANATINIAAAFAIDGRAGLFTTRHKRIFEPCLLEIDYSLQEISRQIRDDDIWVDNDRLRRKIIVFDQFLWRDNVTNSPLNQRAWVFQERLLSARTVHFGRNQVFWECGDKTACERFPDGLPAHPNWHKSPEPKLVRKFLFQDNIYRRELRAPTGGESRSVEPLWTIWSEVIQDFSKRKLTFGSDKLVAISALARLYQPLIEGDCHYVAGLWRKDLVFHLLWRVAGREQASRQEEYRAPTWSWASVDGPIWYSSFFNTESFPGMAEVDEVEVQLASPDHFAAVKHGRIKLVCRLARANCFPMFSYGIVEYELKIGNGDQGLTMVIGKDVTIENGSPISGRWENLVFVPVKLGKGDGLLEKIYTSGLILELVEGKKCEFQRFGVGSGNYAADEMERYEKVFQDFDKDAVMGGFDLVKTDKGVSTYSITII